KRQARCRKHRSPGKRKTSKRINMGGVARREAPMEAPARIGAGRFVQATSRCNLHRLMLLRNFTVIGLTFATVMDAAGHFPINLPTVPLASVTGYLALFNLATFWRLARAWRVTDAELLGHILADIVAMTVLLYFSGGTASPFVGMLLV